MQPKGPYYIGGYSGGGITAYEMAQQLVASGEEVGILVFLDTPTTSEPPLTYKKRYRLAWQRIAEQRAGFFAGAARRKINGYKRRLHQLASKPLSKLRPYEYRSEIIEAAFYKALALYSLKSYAGKVTLFRPELDEAYTLGPEHVVNRSGSWVEYYNGWKKYVAGEIEVHAVPGDHDNMVLEPHVRVLASQLRRCLHEAQNARVEVGAVRA